MLQDTNFSKRDELYNTASSAVPSFKYNLLKKQGSTQQKEIDGPRKALFASTDIVYH